MWSNLFPDEPGWYWLYYQGAFLTTIEVGFFSQVGGMDFNLFAITPLGQILVNKIHTLYKDPWFCPIPSPPPFPGDMNHV